MVSVPARQPRVSVATRRTSLVAGPAVRGRPRSPPGVLTVYTRSHVSRVPSARRGEPRRDACRSRAVGEGARTGRRPPGRWKGPATLRGTVQGTAGAVGTRGLPSRIRVEVHVVSAVCFPVGLTPTRAEGTTMSVGSRLGLPGPSPSPTPPFPPSSTGDLLNKTKGRTGKGVRQHLPSFHLSG